jgi:hypothetical protein
MNSGDLSYIVIVEAVLPFLVLSIVLLLVILSGRKKFREAAKMLIMSVKSGEAKEKESLIAFQTEKLNISNKLAKKNAKKIINDRKFLVRNLVSGLLDKNVEAISQLNQDLSRISSRYHDLKIVLPEPAVVEEPAETEEEIDLKAEVKSLKQEVHVTLTTLNNIFKEFSSMFGEDDIPEGQMSVDQIITAMESFSGKEDTPGENFPSAGETEMPQHEATADDLGEDPMDAMDSLDSQLEESLADLGLADEGVLGGSGADKGDEDLDFSMDSAIDDIDSALDGLELDASDDEEPDWGDAFAESGDTMDGEPK